MKDPRIDKLAELIVNYSVSVQPGQTVFLRSSTIAEPLVLAVYQKILEAGGLPFTNLTTPGMEEIFFSQGTDAQINHVPKPLEMIYETYDVYIHIMAEANTRALSQIDPQRMVLRSRATEKLSKLFDDRSASGNLKWTLTLFPTQAYAQDAEMSLSQYEDFYYQACMPDPSDPVGYWQKVSARQEKIVNWLKDKQQIHVKAPGTDLTLSVAGRKFINCACHENVPDGEVFTGPVEDSVNGCVYFSYPTIFGSREITNVRLWFENGKVVKATADKNEDFLLKTLDTDEGARRLGEFAIGTNEGIRQFTRQILFDEKIGGSFHMALGASYLETGGLNHSAIHWDMICDLRQGGEIWADDQLLYQNGQFVAM